jgi:hypothetical protein
VLVLALVLCLQAEGVTVGEWRGYAAFYMQGTTFSAKQTQAAAEEEAFKPQVSLLEVPGGRAELTPCCDADAAN